MTINDFKSHELRTSSDQPAPAQAANWAYSLGFWSASIITLGGAIYFLVILGAMLTIDFVIVSRIAALQSVLASVVAILLVTASGAIEGVVVGLLQWSVLRRPCPGISRRAWVIATIIGAVVGAVYGLALAWLASPRRPQHVIVSGYGRITTGHK